MSARCLLDIFFVFQAKKYLFPESNKISATCRIANISEYNLYNYIFSMNNSLIWISILISIFERNADRATLTNFNLKYSDNLITIILKNTESLLKLTSEQLFANIMNI